MVFCIVCLGNIHVCLLILNFVIERKQNNSFYKILTNKFDIDVILEWKSLNEKC